MEWHIVWFMTEEEVLTVLSWFENNEPKSDAEGLEAKLIKAAEAWTYEELTAEQPEENGVLIWFSEMGLENGLSFLEDFCEVGEGKISIPGVRDIIDVNDGEEEIKEEDAKSLIERLSISGEGIKGFREKLIEFSKIVDPGVAVPTITEEDLLNIGLDALATEEYGGFEEEELEVMVKAYPQLNRLPTFSTLIPPSRLRFDTANYRLAEMSGATKLKDTEKLLLDALTRDEIELGQTQVRNLMYESGKDDDFKILGLARNMEQRGFREEFPVVVVSLKFGEIRKQDGATKSFIDQLAFAEGDGLEFLIADGNRRRSAVARIEERLERGEYDTKPATKANAEKIVEGGIPCIVHLAHDIDEVHSIRKEIQTAHHRIGQLDWTPYADAFNLEQRFTEMKGRGYSDTFCYKRLGTEMDKDHNDLRREMRALRLLREAVSHNIIADTEMQEHYGITKSYLLSRQTAKFFSFEGGSDGGHWPVAGTDEENDFKEFLKFVFSKDVVQSKESAATVSYQESIRKAMSYDGGGELRNLIDSGTLTVENIKTIVEAVQVEGGSKKMGMKKYLAQVKKKLKAQAWAGEEEIYSSWDNTPKSIEQQHLEAVKKMVGDLIDDIVKAKADNTTPEWMTDLEAVIDECELDEKQKTMAKGLFAAYESIELYLEGLEDIPKLHQLKQEIESRKTSDGATDLNAQGAEPAGSEESDTEKSLDEHD